MKLQVIGSSPAWPNPGGAHTGLLVSGAGSLLLDCGPGVLARLRDRYSENGWPRVDAIAITHFHLDHWGDLVPWVWGNSFGLGHGMAKPELHVPPGGRERLRRFGVGIAEAADAAARATGLRGAGVIDQANQRLTVQADGQVTSPAALAATVVREHDGVALRLGDLGRVVEGAAPRFGEGGVNGVRGLVVVVSGQLGANTEVVAGRVEAALARLAPTIEAAGLTLDPAIFRPSEFIDLAIRNITTSLLLGGALVTVILVLFLADAGAAAISLTAIPLSLLAAILVLDALGFGINTLTLGGLAIALGEVVDDAIIDVENIARRLRLNRERPDPLPPARVVLDASLEVRGSVVYATFVVALVFVPVLLLSGVQGALFRPLGLAYIFATLASLAVALTVTPALTLMLLVRRDGRTGEARVLGWLKRRYRVAVSWGVRHGGPVGLASAVICLLALAALPFFGATFLPEFREGHYLIHMSAVPGT